MPRKGHIAKRGTEADPVYGSDLANKFINSMMWQGKKSTAEGIFYEALTKLQQKGGDEPLKLFTVYSPPQHPAGTVHRTRADAMADERTPTPV